MRSRPMAYENIIKSVGAGCAACHCSACCFAEMSIMTVSEGEGPGPGIEGAVEAEWPERSVGGA